MAGVTQFVFDRPQLAAALSLSGLRVDQGSIIPQLPVLSDPAATLGGSPAFDRQSGRLSEGAAVILRVLAQPSRRLQIVVNAAGSSAWAASSLIAGDEVFVRLQADGGQYDVTLARDWGSALSLVGLPEPDPRGCGNTGCPMALSPHGYIALLAAADCVQSAELRSRLGRTAEWRPVLTADLLEAELTNSQAQPDTRWTISAGLAVAPCDVGGASGTMAIGLAELEKSDLVRPISRGYGFSERGQALVGELGRLRETVGLTLTSRAGDVLRQACLFGCPSSVVLASWAPGGDTLTVDQSGRAAAESLVAEFMTGPLPASRPAAEALCANPACGQPLPPGAKFCPHCGRPAGDAAPQRVCVNCGRTQDPNKKFCTGCGTRYAA
jgi:hypothetical protein